MTLCLWIFPLLFQAPQLIHNYQVVDQWLCGQEQGYLLLDLRPITDVPFGELGSQKGSLMHYSTLLQFLWVLQAGLECVFSFFIKLGCKPASLSLRN